MPGVAFTSSKWRNLLQLHVLLHQKCWCWVPVSSVSKAPMLAFGLHDAVTKWKIAGPGKFLVSLSWNFRSLSSPIANPMSWASSGSCQPGCHPPAAACQRRVILCSFYLP